VTGARCAASLIREAARARRNADFVKVAWRLAVLKGERDAARGGRMLWSVLERAAREAEQVATAAVTAGLAERGPVDREGIAAAAALVADWIRADLGGGAS